MKTFRYALTAVVLSAFALAISPSLMAQATTTQTTLSAAMTASDRLVLVASATGLAAGRTMVVDGEAMLIGPSYVSGTTIPVNRGSFSTQITAHASGAVVFAGPGSYFSREDPVGPCTATDETALPRVVIGAPAQRHVSVYNCQGASATTQRWQLYMRNGYPAFGFASIGGTQAGAAPPVYTGAGAITLLPGVSHIGSAGALAMTLASPALYQNGMVMVIAASTAQAHTITYTPGFFGTTTSSDVCTLGGAIGDNIVVYAVNSVWRVLSTRNCTIA